MDELDDNDWRGTDVATLNDRNEPTFKKFKRIIHLIYSWILQISIIPTAISYLYYNHLESKFDDRHKNDDNEDYEIIISSLDNFTALFLVLFILYTINAYCSPTYSYLNNLRKIGASNNIHTFMKTQFFAHPILNYKMKHYHYDREYFRREFDRDSDSRYDPSKIYTFNSHDTFNYKSWRDISGRFKLNTDGFRGNAMKAMIKLRTNLKIEFADDRTEDDYDDQKEAFINRCKNIDSYFDFYEESTLQGFKEFNLILVGQEAPIGIGLIWYALSTCLLLTEFYNIYLNCYCIEQEFTITKLISNVSDLTQNRTYNDRLPSIMIMGIEDRIEGGESNRIGISDQDGDNTNNLPSLEEVDNHTN